MGALGVGWGGVGLSGGPCIGCLPGDVVHQILNFDPTDPLHTLLMLWCVTNSGSSPTRCSFLSGRLPIHVNTLNRPLSAAGGVDIRMTLISEKLQDMGYFTGVAGKWHGQ